MSTTPLEIWVDKRDALHAAALELVALIESGKIADYSAACKLIVECAEDADKYAMMHLLNAPIGDTPQHSNPIDDTPETPDRFEQI